MQETDNTIHRVLILRGCVRILGLGEVPADQALGTYRKLMKSAQARPDDVKLVLGGLAKLSDPRALNIAMEQVGNDAVRAEAELADGVLNDNHVTALGREMFGPHWIAVQVGGVLLLAALIGAAAIVAGGKPTNTRDRVMDKTPK